MARRALQEDPGEVLTANSIGPVDDTLAFVGARSAAVVVVCTTRIGMRIGQLDSRVRGCYILSYLA